MTPPRGRKCRKVNMHRHRRCWRQVLPNASLPSHLRWSRGVRRALTFCSSLALPYRMRTRAHLLHQRPCPVAQGYGHLMMVLPIDPLFDRQGSLVQEIRILVLALRKNKSSQRRRKQQHRGLRRRQHSTSIQQHLCRVMPVPDLLRAHSAAQSAANDGTPPAREPQSQYA